MQNGALLHHPQPSFLFHDSVMHIIMPMFQCVLLQCPRFDTSLTSLKWDELLPILNSLSPILNSVDIRVAGLAILRCK